MIGIDAVSINRIKQACDRFGMDFPLRFLSDLEFSLCHRDDGTLNHSRLAGFWAAKEAISKALGTGIGGKLSFSDILLSKDVYNAPQATLKADKKQIFGISHIALSITHDQGLAIAVALVETRGMKTFKRIEI